MTADDTRADKLGRTLRRALRIADEAVIVDICSYCLSDQIAGVEWFDTATWLNEHELTPRDGDMAREAIAYAIDRRLVVQHPHHPELLRVIDRRGGRGAR